MGPKKGKEVIDENYWRTLIEDYPLDEENWKVKVILIEAAGSDQDRIYLNKFENFAAEERRFVIKNICKSETIFMINQLGGEKKVKDENFRIFEEGQNYLTLKQDIPPDVLALIIKHRIMKMKEEYLFIKRQRLQVREGMRRESTTMINMLEVKGTVNVSQPEPDIIPPSKKGKKGEADLSRILPEPDKGKKYNTQLRVRGEEWRDKIYVDDFPTDGPNLYVALTGFVEPLLSGHLLKIGVPLRAIIQVRIDPTFIKVPSSLFRSTKRGQSQTEILTDKSVKFWENMQQLRIQKDTADIFKNTVFLVFSPPYWDIEKLSGTPDKIYDELCFLMYDIQDLTRQHFHYLNNMDIINIPDPTEDLYIDKQYHQQIDDLPLECVTIYSVLDAILQTVCKRQAVDEKSSRSSLSTAVTMNQSQSSDDKIKRGIKLVKEVFNKLCNSEGNKKSYRVTLGEEYENYKDPIIIHYGDFAKYNTFHLGNINLDNIVWSTLFGLPLHKLWKSQKPPNSELKAKISFHVNVLLSCFDREDVETAELYRLIHILAFRKLYNNRSSLKKHHLQSTTISDFKKTYLKRTILAEPLYNCSSLFRNNSSLSTSYPSMTKCENYSNVSYNDDCEEQRIEFLFDCPDISELVSATEIANEKSVNHFIDDFEYFEDFTGICAFQMILDAFNKYNCVDYKYCEVTDCFLLMFFNSHDKDGIAREEWRCHLSTPLCLQDFFDFVLQENYDWIQNEEKIYDQNAVLQSESLSKDFIDPLTLHSCVGDAEVNFDLLMKGSLKYQEIAQLEKTSSNSMDAKLASPKKTTLSTSSTKADSKSSKKTKSPAQSTPKKLRQSFMATAPSSITSILSPKMPFLGYNLSDRRVEVFGKDAIYFSKDGTKVISRYTLIIPLNVEYIVLNVLPGNGNNEFWVHKALGDEVSSEILDICESFRITTKDKIMINIRKRTYQLPLPSMCKLSFTDNKRKESILTNTKLSSGVQKILETKSFHSLYTTWPNGLITESVHEYNSSVISHIKQYYLNPLPNLNEEMRCITLNGEVAIFKSFGDIEVLKPDGSYIKITKCQKKIITFGSPEDFQSETSSDKSKKSKGKDKSGKERKSSKTSSKSSKNAFSEGNMHVEAKVPEYDLIIEEFESIDNNGLRQKWINNNLFFTEKLLIRTATDYCLGEIFSRRMDGTSILLNKDGLQIVTFPNGTRIISRLFVVDEEIFPEWTEEEKECYDMLSMDFIETDTIKSKCSMSQKSYRGYIQTNSRSSLNSMTKKNEDVIIKKERTDGYVSIKMVYTIEHANFTTVTINKINEKILIDSPNNTSVIIDTNNHYEIKLDPVTSAEFEGENLLINYEACPECHSNTVCNIKIKPNEISNIANKQQYWMKMKDSFCKKIIINDEGVINVIDEPSSTVLLQEEEIVNADVQSDNEDKVPDRKSESYVMSHGKCREMYMAKSSRYFVLKRELTCSELVHKALLEECVQACRWQPWCSTSQYDTFGDHRNLVSLLIPIHLTNSEKWHMDSTLAGKPTYLTYKDLKKDPGKGFYYWMRPYERFEPKPTKPDNVLLPRLPRAFILRILEQQWKESERDELKGAKELLRAILRYRHIMESDSKTILNIPILDPRSNEERHADEIIQAVAHRIYHNLKVRLEEDVQSRVKASVTTKLRPADSEASFEGELEDDSFYELKALEEERENMIKEIEEVDKTSDKLKRYWHRRAEEYKEEKFYQYLLREGSVPPYFRNVLGGAIWWEMNHTADEAVVTAERRKIDCVCDSEEGSSSRYRTAIPPHM